MINAEQEKVSSREELNPKEMFFRCFWPHKGTITKSCRQNDY